MEKNDEAQQPLEQLLANRRTKLEALVELGLDPFPRRFRVGESVSGVKREFDGKSTEELEAEQSQVRLGGRLVAVEFPDRKSVV